MIAVSLAAMEWEYAESLSAVVSPQPGSVWACVGLKCFQHSWECM